MTRWWQLKYFFSFSPRSLGKMNPIWRAYFWDGLKPPPRWGLLFVCFFFLWDEVTLKVDQLTCWCRKTSSGNTSWGIGSSLSHYLPRFYTVLPSTKLTWHFRTWKWMVPAYFQVPCMLVSGRVIYTSNPDEQWKKAWLVLLYRGLYYPGM